MNSFYLVTTYNFTTAKCNYRSYFMQQYSSAFRKTFYLVNKNMIQLNNKFNSNNFCYISLNKNINGENIDKIINLLKYVSKSLK